MFSPIHSQKQLIYCCSTRSLLLSCALAQSQSIYVYSYHNKGNITKTITKEINNADLFLFSEGIQAKKNVAFLKMSVFLLLGWQFFSFGWWWLTAAKSI